MLPRITFLISAASSHLPFAILRRQFPVIPAYAFSVHRAQGSTLERVGLVSSLHCCSLHRTHCTAPAAHHAQHGTCCPSPAARHSLLSFRCSPLTRSLYLPFMRVPVFQR